jgi:hypothetical protein
MIVKSGLHNERGRVTIKAVFWVLVFAAAIYAGYKVMPPVVSFYMLKTEVKDEARIAHMYSDEKVAERILDKAATWEVPLEKNGITVERWRDQINIKVAYTVHFTFFGRYSKSHVFHIDVDAPLKDTSRILH